MYDDFLTLRVVADCYQDAQMTRISIENRLRSATVDAAWFGPILEGQRAAEHAMALAMRRQYRKTVRAHLPGVDEWQKASTGVGEHLVARILGHLGHPRIAQPYRWLEEAPEGHRCGPTCGQSRHLVAFPEFKRTPGQLWSYCGLGSPDRQRSKGMSAEEALACGSPRLKSLLFVAAECAIKQPGRSLPDPTPTTAPKAAAGRGVVLPPETMDEAAPKAASSRGGDSPPPQPNGVATPTCLAVGGEGPSTTSHAPLDSHSETAGGGVWRHRQVYETRRAATQDRRHAVECRRCGPSGHPALPESPWSRAHQHADALRIVAKSMLLDLWHAAT